MKRIMMSSTFFHLLPEKYLPKRLRLPVAAIFTCAAVYGDLGEISHLRDKLSAPSL